MRILVVCGGSSAERDDSLGAGKMIGDALQAAGHEVTYFDPGDDTAFALLRTVVLDRDLVFPVLYGKGGEDGLIQAVLDSLGVPYVGPSPSGSQTCYDKVHMLNLLHTHGILVPPTDLVTYRKLKKHPLAQQPCIVKPRFEGAKSDARIIQDVSHAPEDIEEIFARQGSMLIQPLLMGGEFAASIMGDTPLPVAGLVQDMRYQSPPQHVPQEIQQQAQLVALKIYQMLGCRHMATIDFIASSDGHVYCIDVNTLPQFTAQGAFVVSAISQGLTLPKAMDYIVQYAHQRR